MHAHHREPEPEPPDPVYWVELTITAILVWGLVAFIAYVTSSVSPLH